MTSRRRRTRPRSGSDRGSVTVEIAILGPALLLLIFGVVQAGMWFYARSLALAAAQEGVSSARAYGASPAAGISRAQTFLREQAGDSLTDTAVSTAGSTRTVVRVQVRGRAISVLPGVPGIAIHQSAQGPVERFTAGAAP